METPPRWHTTKYNLLDTEVEIAVTLSSHVRLLFVFIYRFWYSPSKGTRVR